MHFYYTTIGCDNRLRNNNDCGAALLIRMENEEKKTYLTLMWFMLNWMRINQRI